MINRKQDPEGGLSSATQYYNRAIAIVKRVGTEHERRGSWQPETMAEEKKEALALLDKSIESGEPQAYVLKALLAASDDWSTFTIVRFDLFREILLKGVDHDALSPDCTNAWQVMGIAAANNNPARFMKDIIRYLDILTEASGAGVKDAWDIMCLIWPLKRVFDKK